MSKKSRINKRKSKKKLRLVFISIIIIYLIFRLIPILYASTTKTYVVKNGYIETVSKTRGILIKKEETYKANMNGYLHLFKDEGDMIKVGQKISQVNSMDIESLNNEINKIDNKIEILENSSNKIFKSDLDKNTSNINIIIDEIRNEIIKQNYQNVYNLKEVLNAEINKKQSLTGNKGYIGGNIEQLKERRKQIIKQIEEQKESYYSNISGILSYNIDGLEKIFTVENMLNITPDKYKIIEGNTYKVEDDTKIEYGQPMFKICDNFSWYILVKLDNEGINCFKEGKNVNIRVCKTKDILKARIFKIIEGNNESVVVLNLNSYLHKYYNDRYLDIEIIKQKYEGLKIHNKSIIERNGLHGVYIKNLNNVVFFRPIKVVGKNEDYTIVEEGVKRIIKININGKEEYVRTLSMYDDVFLDGTKVKQTQVVN